MYYLIDPTFDKVNGLFGLPFKNENGRASFWTYYAPKVEIKDFIVFVDGKSFINIRIKTLLKWKKAIIIELVICGVMNIF